MSNITSQTRILTRFQAFEHAFLQACRDWIDAAPTVPVIACGMVGSNLGWSEIPYLQVPIDCGKIAAALGEVRTSYGATIHIVPGLLEFTALPNVMRGEETRVIGVLTEISQRSSSKRSGSEDEALIGLPGTHSKWVRVQGTTITHFETFMTGEVYKVLCENTILGRAMQHKAVSPLRAEPEARFATRHLFPKAVHHRSHSAD